MKEKKKAGGEICWVYVRGLAPHGIGFFSLPMSASDGPSRFGRNGVEGTGGPWFFRGLLHRNCVSRGTKGGIGDKPGQPPKFYAALGGGGEAPRFSTVFSGPIVFGKKFSIQGIFLVY